ncbi:UDP-galactose transporter 1 [Colletotrichum truncatum]|uniref:UDP-galactose transporter 1 n=1 Tax=Colletotrichum truncatum TaxID=5467 RepID=A0ACC3ZB55_COLTU
MASGIILVQPAAASYRVAETGDSHGALVGVLAMVISGVCVALAGVLMETILKTPNKFVARNAQLAAYSCFCAVVGVLARPASIMTGSGNNYQISFFHGYHSMVWIFVLLQAAGGFIVAWSVRTTSTVAKNYAQAVGFLIASVGPTLLSSKDVPHLVSQHP